MDDHHYTLGYLAGKLESVARSLQEHREEEREVWEDIKRKLEKLETWKSRVSGMASVVSGAIALVASAIYNYFFGR